MAKKAKPKSKSTKSPKKRGVENKAPTKVSDTVPPPKPKKPK